MHGALASPCGLVSEELCGIDRIHCHQAGFFELVASPFEVLNRRSKSGPVAGCLEALECSAGGVSIAQRIACAQALLNNCTAGSIGVAHAATC
jgi:hypothetical protein